MAFLLAEDGTFLLQEDGDKLLLDVPVTVHTVALSFRAGAASSGSGYISRRRGAKWFGLARIFLDDETQNLSTGRVTHPSRVYTARIEDWGEISKSIPVPSGMPEASRLRIRLIDTDRNYRDVFGGQTPQGRTVQLKWMQEGTSEVAADIHFTGEIETFEKGPGYLDVEAIGNMLSWLDERFLDLITQANFPEFPDVKTAFLPVIIGHVQGRAVSIGFSPGAVASPDAGALVDASDAATVIKDQILAAVFLTAGPFTAFSLQNDWLEKVETPYGQGIALILNEFNLQAAAGVLELADAEYARDALEDLLDATDARATEFAGMSPSRATIIENFRGGVTSFFGADWANMLAAVNATIASLGEDPPEELFAPQGAIPLPHIGFLEGVGDRWGAAMHPLWNVLAIYRKRSNESVFTGVPFAEYNVTLEVRTFEEIPGRSFTCTFIDFIENQDPDGDGPPEIRMDADGAYERAAFGDMPAVGYVHDGIKAPLQNPVDGFLILKDHLFHKAGDASVWDVTALALLRAKFETGGATIPPLFMDRATIESMTCRERIAQFNASFQTDFLDTNRGKYTLIRVDDTDPERPVLTESHIVKSSFRERSPAQTINRFIAKYSPDYTESDGWFDTAIADNLADQEARGKLQEQTVLLWDVRNAQTAQAAVSDRLRYTSLRSYIQTLTVHLKVASHFLELARLFGITHEDGMKAGGYVNREVKIINIRASFKTRQAVIESIVRAPIRFGDRHLAAPSFRAGASAEIAPFDGFIWPTVAEVAPNEEYGPLVRGIWEDPERAIDKLVTTYAKETFDGGGPITLYNCLHLHTWESFSTVGLVSIDIYLDIEFDHGVNTTTRDGFIELMDGVNVNTGESGILLKHWQTDTDVPRGIYSTNLTSGQWLDLVSPTVRACMVSSIGALHGDVELHIHGVWAIPRYS